MRTSDRIANNHILQHKEYFDQKLIDININLHTEVSSLTSANTILLCSNQGYKQKITSLQVKIKDMNSQKYALNKKYLEAKNENDEILEYLKKMQKEIDELKKENEQHEKEINQQEKEIKNQKSIIDKLKYMNSTNSNLPSSMDIMGRTKAKAEASTRVSSGRKRGGQKHHPLHKSKVTDKVDHIKTMKVKKAPTGAIPVKGEDGKINYYVTQEVDLLLKSVITETRYYIDENGKDLDKKILNKYAINPLVYSGNFKATTVYLNQKGTIPLQRLSDMIYEISKGSIQLRPGTISKWCNECHKKSEKAKEEILKDILSGALIHVDETGMKVNGEQYWIHVLTSEKGSIYLMTKTRGDKEKGPVKLLEFYSGIVLHDHFTTYQILKLCQHAECNAHIDRYLKSGIDFDHNEECQELLDLLHEMLHRKYKLIEEGKTSMPDDEIKKFEISYLEVLKRGVKSYNDKHPNIEKKYEPDFVKTFKRMIIFKEDHLRFIKNFIVPYTNNNAEKGCRAVKAKKNTSRQFVSELGGQAYVSILSLLQTSRIKNENALETLKSVFN